jgi:hypothetical protein
MQGLEISPDTIVPTSIPDDMDVPSDLSITSERLADLTGIDPMPVREAIDTGD